MSHPTNPIDEKDISESRLILALRKHRQSVWLVLLSAGFALFLAWMPRAMRLLIWRALVVRGSLSGMLLLFGLLAVSLVWSVGQQVDTWAFLIFNLRGPRPVWLDRTMVAFTQVGSGVASFIVGLILFSAGDRLVAYELILGTFTLWMVVELVKAVIGRPRPFIHSTQARIVGSRVLGRSFPSGHTSQAFFLVTLMIQHYHPNVWITTGLYAIAVLVGITRLYVGAHYPRDVLAGALLGTVWGLLGALIDGYMTGGI